MGYYKIIYLVSNDCLKLGCFDARNKEHRKYAAGKHTTIRFYRRYPTKSSVRSSSSSRHGHFDNLRQLVALSFEVGNEDVGKRIACEYDKGGIFQLQKMKRNELISRTSDTSG